MTQTVDVQRILQVLRGRRFPLTGETKTQEAIQAAFIEDGVVHEREARLAPGDIVDFRIGGIIIEVKLAGSKRAIHRQCVRYCEHDGVDVLILVTSVAMNLPGISKPTFVVSLGRAWL